MRVSRRHEPPHPHLVRDDPATQPRDRGRDPPGLDPGGPAARGRRALLLVLDRALELLERALDVAAHDRAGELLRQPGPNPAARDAELQPQLDARAVAPLAQPPASALVDAGDRVPGQIALG